MNDTIAAVATAAGIGSVAIVRLSGPKAVEIAKKVTRRDTFKPRYAHLCNLYDEEDELIDEAIVIWFRAPHSFTTEDVVEFQCHGGTVVAQTILQTVLRCGARLAEPGEFTRRAFLGGRIDLSEAEAIAKMIEAQSEEAVRLLARQMKGELRRYVESLRERLVRAVAHAEVAIDYAEEDLPADLVDQIDTQLAETAEEIARLEAASLRRRGLIEGFKVAIVGKPNVGKSSLLNALLAYDRAIVSDVAGTTRDTIEERLRIGSHLVRIIDTAGIREAEDTIERIGVERSLRAIEESDVVLALFDLSRPWDAEDDALLGLLQRFRKKKAVLCLLNKADLPKRMDLDKLRGWECRQLPLEGKEQTVAALLQEKLDRMAAGEGLMLVSTRQIEAIGRARESIEAAREPLASGELELFAFHLNEAIEAIGSISRPVDFNEIMDKMFGEFCLGK